MITGDQYIYLQAAHFAEFLIEPPQKIGFPDRQRLLQLCFCSYPDNG